MFLSDYCGSVLFSIQRMMVCQNRLFSSKPKASLVLTSYLQQQGEPPWTSFFVKMSDVENDQFGMSHFNWPVRQTNYHVLRIGCYPYIKYHCSQRPHQDLHIEDSFYRILKIINLGIPCLMYGTAAVFLIKHRESVHLVGGEVFIYFLLEEDKGARY